MKPNQLTVILGITVLSSFFVACGGNKEAPRGQTASPATLTTPTVNVTTVESHELNRQLRLPGELQPFQDVAIYAKVQGFVETITVDRGSMVKKGQLLARLRAPELDTQRREAEARVSGVQAQKIEVAARISTIRAQRLEAEAKLAAEESTYRRLKAASNTPGVVAGNDVEIAERTVESSRARVQAMQETERAAQAQVKTLDESERALRESMRGAQNIEEYLRITAPFDGVITERNAHPGSLAMTSGMPMVRLQQVLRLRLVIAVPEAEVAGIANGAKINFTLPAFPGEIFNGTVQRSSRALDAGTRTMPVELDIENSRGRLSPGMFPEVQWPTKRSHPSLFVPPTAIAVTTERSFVVRIRDNTVEWVDVKRGASMNIKGNDLIEVFGDLSSDDVIAVRGTDELRAGTKVTIRKSSGGK
ncbi:MAG TPA: efflux RND transporter periplasmic adaptor subunit [Blastocatellia bacterium]|nr:efflux RND transporter periplasmic adaptor subunit [Blastocatellia bacterium]HMV83236.1 efflux RND transporter periplasmic adaptor subunit [Blastocatellia bacterium]HMX27050.1 efflux RND transporter periplasmic adaptor subunit [Blastocatellia bacterium]HMY72235.1 efflux RND transporter periplasmic adaptor subunit [Blastocatellia bacterium]HMZ20771.1 efflux RND transporter periplasmic adaptor subunit [Blastocatellia bacterium]